MINTLPGLNPRFRVLKLLTVFVSLFVSLNKLLLVFSLSFFVMPRAIRSAILVLLGTMSTLAQGDVTVTRVSENEAGMQGNGQSFSSSISADGRLIAFSSFATNLVPNDTNMDSDVFVKNVETGEIVRASEDTAGTQGNDFSGFPSISADGRFVAFLSEATNLVPGEADDNRHVFVKNLETGEIVRASEDAVGGLGNRTNDSLSLSADGSLVVFESDASNLLPGDTNGRLDVFVKNVTTGEIVRASEDAQGMQGNRDSGVSDRDTGNLGSNNSISADSRLVVFPSSANNLVPGGTNNNLDVFVKNIETREIARVSENAERMQGNDRSGDSGISISADGQWVAFSSFATNLILNDTNEIEDVFIKNLETGEILRASENAAGEPGNAGSYSPSLNANGSFVTFESNATNLVPDSSNRAGFRLFMKNLETGEIMRVSDSGRRPSISADGQSVAFESFATNLVPDDTNEATDVFLAEVASVQAPTTPGNFRFAVYSRTAAEVFWDRSSDNGSILYEVIRNGELIGVLDALSVFEDNLQPGVDYTYMLTAIDNDGNRSATATVSFTTDDTVQPPVTNLSPVTGLRADIYSATSAEIFWDRMPGIGQQYRVYADGVEVETTDGTSWYSNEFEPGSTTEMTVVAIDGANESEERSVTVTTRGGSSGEPPTGVPAVSGLRAAVYSNDFAEVFWDRPTGQAYIYRVFFNGVLVEETDGVSWLSRDFAPGSSTEVTVIAVDSQGAESPPATVIVQTPGGDIDPGTTIYAIGDKGPGGGTVFYVTNGGLNGLEAAPSDQDTRAQWCSQVTDIEGVDNLASFATPDSHSGAHNTPLIVAVCGDTSAAGIAANFEWPNGQTDGFLPNKDELALLTGQRDIVGGSTNGDYWSSTEIASNPDGTSSSAVTFEFRAGGELDASPKSLLSWLRAIRAF